MAENVPAHHRHFSSHLFREIYKNAWLNKVSSLNCDKAGPNQGVFWFPQKPERFWVVFCIHDDTEAYLEAYTDMKLSVLHRPVWFAHLNHTLHISPTICSDYNEYEFAVTITSGVLRLLAPTREAMSDWVDTLRSKLTEMHILSPCKNMYSALPQAKTTLLPTRDPTSPLPAPPMVPPTIMAGIETLPANPIRNNSAVSVTINRLEGEIPPTVAAPSNCDIRDIETPSHTTYSQRQVLRRNLSMPNPSPATTEPYITIIRVADTDESVRGPHSALPTTSQIFDFDVPPAVAARSRNNSEALPPSTTTSQQQLQHPQQSTTPDTEDATTQAAPTIDACHRCPADGQACCPHYDCVFVPDIRSKPSAAVTATRMDSQNGASASNKSTVRPRPAETSVSTRRTDRPSDASTSFMIRTEPSSTSNIIICHDASNAAARLDALSGVETSNSTANINLASPRLGLVGLPGASASNGARLARPTPAVASGSNTNHPDQQPPVHDRRKVVAPSTATEEAVISQQGPPPVAERPWPSEGADTRERHTRVHELATVTTTTREMTRLTLREQQVLRLHKEILHPSGVRIQLSRKDCNNAIALVDIFGAVWVAGWKQKDNPMLYNLLHIGDQLISVDGLLAQNASETHKHLRKACSFSPYVTVIIKRVPFGKVFAIQRESEGQSLGIVQEHNTAVIKEVVANSLAARQGLSQKATTCDRLAFTNWVLTEINGRPLNLFFKSNEVRDRLNAIGLEISILVQPFDLMKQLKKQLKSIRNYKEYIVQ